MRFHIPISRAVSLVFVTGVVAACSSTPTVSDSDIRTACGKSYEESTSPLNDLSDSVLEANATSAIKRSQAAQRIASVDERYSPLAEALMIIADAAQTLTEDPSGEETPINWDFIKLAQAAAADQCELLMTHYVKSD